MRTLKKTRKCLNCSQVLSEVYDYCPICGQENNDINVDFWFLLKDFLGNYLSLDSKFFRSIIPFFFNPGYLTLQFMDGKRKSYANPVRLYIIISLIYFFILNIIVSDFSSKLNNDLSAQDKAKVDSIETVIITDLDNIPKDSTANVFTIDTQGDTTMLWPLSTKQWNLFMKLKDNEKLSEEQVVDSLNIVNRSDFTKYVVKQIVRVYKKDKEYLAAGIVQNLSLMMFLMLPVFALIMKLLYIRRKALYINHLIHAIHMHSYAFLVYSLALGLMFWLIESNTWHNLVSILAFAVVSLNAYLSIKKVYGQGWLKTLVKFWFIGFIYFYAMLFALSAEIFISFLIF